MTASLTAIRTLILKMGVVAAFLPFPASAFTLETAVTKGCHERITVSAQQTSSWPEGSAPPIQSKEDQVLLQNLPFGAPSNADIWLMGLPIGVRNNDLLGVSLPDLPEMSVIHNSSGTQTDHCLRASDQDFSQGDMEAVASCRDFILREAALALGQGTDVDYSAYESVPVALQFQTQNVQLPSYPFHLGRALHALQDSFAHTFRSSDMKQVRTVFTFTDPVLLPIYTEARDGHSHSSIMDGCGEDTDFNRLQVKMATEASVALLTAVGSPGTRSERLARVSAVLDDYLTYESGCAFENGYCGSLQVFEESIARRGCSIEPSSLALEALGLVALAFLLKSRRRLPKHIILLAICFLPSWVEASSQDALGPHPRVAIHALGGLSVDRGALNVAVGVQYALTPSMFVGVDLEWNPWVDLISAGLSPGVLNGYGVFGFRWKQFENIELFSLIKLGTSVLLFDAVSAYSGSTGLFLGVSPLTLRLQLRPHTWLELSPNVSLAAPQLRGVPLVYRQYRFNVGLVWGI